MARRVALARARARNPEVLLLDEPFGAVDALTRTVLQSLLLALQRSTRVEEALRVARRTVVLGGRPARVVLGICRETLPVRRMPRAWPKSAWLCWVPSGRGNGRDWLGRSAAYRRWSRDEARPERCVEGSA
jgi:hypothetical protein